MCFRAQISQTHRRLGHAIPDEQDHILDQGLVTRFPHSPPSNRLLPIVILERRRILARLGKGQRSVRLTRDVDFSRSLGVQSEEVFVPSKVPLLDSRVGSLEEIRDRGRIALVVGDLEGEVFVGDTVVESFGSVDGCVDLEEVRTWEVSRFELIFRIIRRECGYGEDETPTSSLISNLAPAKNSA